MTRAAIKLIKEGENDFYFYSHCDGYPTRLLLNLLHIHSAIKNDYNKLFDYLNLNYENVSNFPGDIEYAYVIDYDNQIIKSYSGNTDKYHSKLIRVDSFLATENELEIF